MDKMKRIGLYGVSGIGKTTIMKEVIRQSLNVTWLEGAQLVIKAAGLTLGDFKKQTDENKYLFREKAIDAAFEVQRKEKKHIIIDGHLILIKGKNSFENVMTHKDVMFYTDYIYLTLQPDQILNRHQNDRNKKRDYCADTLLKWMELELGTLKNLCEKHRFNLHVLDATNSKECVKFICDYIEA